MTRKTKMGLGGLAALVVIAIVVQNLRGHRDKAMEVETEPIVRKDLTAVVSAPGRIEPKRLVDVSANTMGKIVNLAVREGDRVAKGDFLMEIDPTPYETAARSAEAAVAAAEANLRLTEANREEARLELERVQELRQRGSATDRELTRAATAHEVLEAQVAANKELVAQAGAALRSAQHELSKVRITSEITGVITRLNVDEGENAVTGTMNNPGTVLLTIADLSVLEAEVKVDETDVVDVAIGQRAKVEIDAFPGETYEGTVTEVGNSPILRGDMFGEQAADFKVVITLQDTVHQARPGLSATADIETATRQGALAVPIPAVTLREAPADSAQDPAADHPAVEEQGDSLSPAGAKPTAEKEGVFVVKNGVVQFRPVKTGIAGEKDFEVLEGLSEGELVVTGDFKALRELEDGDKVKVKKKEEGKDGKHPKKGSTKGSGRS